MKAIRGTNGLFSGKLDNFLCLLFLGLSQEVDEVVLPDGGLGVGAVAAGGVGDGDEDELCVGHLVDHFFGDA